MAREADLARTGEHFPQHLDRHVLTQDERQVPEVADEGQAAIAGRSNREVVRDLARRQELHVLQQGRTAQGLPGRVRQLAEADDGARTGDDGGRDRRVGGEDLLEAIQNTGEFQGAASLVGRTSRPRAAAANSGKFFETIISSVWRNAPRRECLWRRVDGHKLYAR